jgi:hypothetical protein
MKLRTLWIIIGAIFVILIAAYFLTGGEVQAPVVGQQGIQLGTVATDTATGADSSSVPAQGSASGTSSSQTSVNVYLISLNAAAPNVPSIGCGDSVFPVKEMIPKTEAVLSAALTKLLSIKDQNVKIGAASYYNALYQSNLKLDSAVIANGIATVKLSGTVQSGGECDDPRIVAQIKNTVMQFPSIKQANVFINNTKLEDYFSLK